MMDYRATSVKAMIDTIADTTFNRVKQWFRENPQEPYCYWARDELIAIKDKDNKELLDKHPEIDDINDHTTVYFDSKTNTMTLRTFCPKLKLALEKLHNTGFTGNKIYGIKWTLSPENDNYRIDAYEED